jgi:hypothetical protein
MRGEDRRSFSYLRFRSVGFRFGRASLRINHTTHFTYSSFESVHKIRSPLTKSVLADMPCRKGTHHKSYLVAEDPDRASFSNSSRLFRHAANTSANFSPCTLPRYTLVDVDFDVDEVVSSDSGSGSQYLVARVDLLKAAPRLRWKSILWYLSRSSSAFRETSASEAANVSIVLDLQWPLPGYRRVLLCFLGSDAGVHFKST